MSRTRKSYTPEEKVAILKRHLVEKVPVSDLCDELGLNPTVFYVWQKQLFEHGAAAAEQLRHRAALPRPLGSAANTSFCCFSTRENPTGAKTGPSSADLHAVDAMRYHHHHAVNHHGRPGRRQ